jgi:hypothetical protein
MKVETAMLVHGLPDWFYRWRRAVHWGPPPI